MRIVRCSIIALALCCVSTVTLAHGTGQHVLGTVTAIDQKHLEIKTQKGTTVDVQINKQTRFKEKSNPKGTSLPAVGDRVVVEAIKDNNVLMATEVHFSAVKKVMQQSAPVPAPAPIQQVPGSTPTP
jgi:Domain of unknown function (DUF5666)